MSRIKTQASATGPMWRSLSGLMTEQMTWSQPSSTSSARTLIHARAGLPVLSGSGSRP
jgi:hypothetical protein